MPRARPATSGASSARRMRRPRGWRGRRPRNRLCARSAPSPWPSPGECRALQRRELLGPGDARTASRDSQRQSRPHGAKLPRT
eukprot:4988507-Pyramimonas_sp.AAC.1